MKRILQQMKSWLFAIDPCLPRLLPSILMMIGSIIGLSIMICLLAWSMAHAQVACFQSGNMTSCLGPRSGQDTLQTDFGHGQGVVTDSKGHLTPYSVSPAPRGRTHQTSPQPYSYESSRPSSVAPDILQPYDPGSILIMPGFGGE